jgi:molecular chaperone GrpE
MQTQEPGKPTEPMIPPSEPLGPSSEPVTPPSEPLMPPSEPAPPSEPEASPSEPIPPPIQAERAPVPAGDALAEQLAVARASLADMAEATLRAEAELDNIRRRVLDDISRAHRYAIEAFAEAVLPVRDSLETALQVDTPSVESAKEGMALTLRQLEAAFAKNKLTEIEPEPGERVDPALHRAISIVPAAPSANSVVSVLQKGYRIGDRVLRPALVTVARERSGDA